MARRERRGIFFESHVLKRYLCIFAISDSNVEFDTGCWYLSTSFTLRFDRRSLLYISKGPRKRHFRDTLQGTGNQNMGVYHDVDFNDWHSVWNLVWMYKGTNAAISMYLVSQCGFSRLKSWLRCCLKSTRKEHSYFNGGGSTVSISITDIDKRSTGVNVLSTTPPHRGTCLVSNCRHNVGDRSVKVRFDYDCNKDSYYYEISLLHIADTKNQNCLVLSAM